MQYIDDDVVENTEIFVFYISVPVGEIGYTEGQNNVEMNIRDTDSKSLICIIFLNYNSSL